MPKSVSTSMVATYSWQYEDKGSSVKTFHHGGRIGDLVYALWTMKALGGGILYVSDYHHPNWSLDIARSMESFLRYQPYVEDVRLVPYSSIDNDDGKAVLQIDYNLQHAEDDYNPEKFPEFNEASWPGNCHIAKRYAVHFGLEFDGKPWIEAPGHLSGIDISLHLPSYRLVRTVEDWCVITALIVDKNASISFLDGRNATHDLLETSEHINCSAVFLGAVSSCHAIAEGLGKPRLVEQAPGCFNVNPTLCLNGMSNAQVVEEVRKYL